MQIIFDDNQLHKALAPFTLTRPVAEIRIGILTIAETWQKMLAKYFDNLEIGYNTAAYLNAKFPAGDAQNGLTINGNIKPTEAIAKKAAELKPGQKLLVNAVEVVSYGPNAEEIINLETDNIVEITAPWHIFQKNGTALSIDFDLITKGKTSQPLSETNRVSGRENIFIEPGAKVEHSILNATTGPIYIGKAAEVMEGSVIRGPFALCEHGVVKMAAKIYGPTTIGPYCKVGGEISNSVFQAYSNKGHDGFLGNSVVGEWCNFGADTNSSNLKNNYSNVKVYSYASEKIEVSDVLFCGVLMGDHSKTGINTMLNTATVVGVSANIFGGGFPEKHIPSFTWGGVDRMDKFILDKAFEVAENMMGRRKITLTGADKSILTYLYDNLA